MKTLFFNIIFLSVVFSYAQNSSIVVNSKNNTPIPYVNVWIEGENIGTTSTECGFFNLEKSKIKASKTIVFYAVGFETKKISVEHIKDTISLNPKILNPKQKSILKRKKKIKIDAFLFSRIDFFYGSGETPWMRGKFFPYLKRYKNTPLLNSFKIYTKSDIDSATFNVRIYKKGKEEQLGAILHDKNIIAIAKKGSRLTEVDVSNLNISFPEEGIYIVFE